MPARAASDGDRDLIQRRGNEVAGISRTQGDFRRGFPDDVDARAELVLAVVPVMASKRTAEIDGQRRQQLPFVLQVDAVGPAGEVGAVGDAERLVAGMQARPDRPGRNQRQGIGLSEAGDALALHEEAAAQRVPGGTFQLASPWTPVAKLVRCAHGAKPLNIRSPNGSGS